jgi:phage tail sheath protein FI
MAFQLSPGVKVNEIDLTNIIPAVSTSGGAFVGQFHWGPVLDYTIVENRSRLEALFGKPSDVNYVDWFSAMNFLAYSNNLNVIRVVDEATALNASADGLGVLVKNEEHYNLVQPTAGSAVIAAKYPGALGNSIEVHMADASTFTDWEYASQFDGKPGTSEYAASLGISGANDELHIVVIDAGGQFTGVPGAILERFQYVSKASNAKTLDGAPNFYGSVLNTQSEYVWWMGNPTAGYGSDGAVTAITPVGDGLYGTGDVPAITIVGDGTGATATAVMSASGVAIDVQINTAGTGYVATEVLTLSNGVTIEVDTVDVGGEILTFTVTNVGTGVVDATGDAATGGSGAGASFDVEAGFAVASVTIDTAGANYSTAPTVGFDAPVSPNGTQESDAAATVSADLDDWNIPLATGVSYKVLDWGTAPTGVGARDGVALVLDLTAGADGTAADDQDLIAGWNLFENAEVVDVSILFTGDAGGQANSQAVIQHVIDNVAEKRKDVIVCFSPDLADVFNVTPEAAAENCVEFRSTKINRSSSYAVMDSGWKYQYDLYNDKYRYVPLNGDIAGTMANTDEVADPWYSPAGYTRGRIKNVISLVFSPSKTQRDILYKVGINPVVSFTGEGVVLYGDRTQQTKSSAFSKINIRRLFIVLEKAIATAAKYQLFEFNDQFTRSQFKNMVEPFLREVKGRRGIYDFQVVCDDTNNTPEVIDRSEFVADIYIKPAYSINFITLNFVAVRTGVEFEEIIGLQQ